MRKAWTYLLFTVHSQIDDLYQIDDMHIKQYLWRDKTFVEWCVCVCVFMSKREIERES